MGESHTEDGAHVRVENTIPILSVSDLATSIDYYTEVLGFRVDWGPESRMVSVSRDGHAIMLCEDCQGCPGTWVWIGVEDVMPLFEQFRARGAAIRLPPTNYSWALEIQVMDPDGHVLRFGSEPIGSLPYADRAS